MATGAGDLGHAAHSQPESRPGLAGEMPRPIKVTMLGAGSHFTSTLVNDLLHIEDSAGGTITLIDIDGRRLDLMTTVAEKMLAHQGRHDWSIEATTDRVAGLPGTDYLVSCIEVSGLACVRHDNDIPARYGV